MPETMFNGLTGVHSAYRRRGIALALKLLTIQYAKAHGARRSAPIMTAERRDAGDQPHAGIRAECGTLASQRRAE
ncbi:MAG: hypothetical protein IPK52_20520 [Chloroflexi bacterium]|nr:hypothetical protein [Chloroflexota bacterium]